MSVTMLLNSYGKKSKFMMKFIDQINCKKNMYIHCVDMINIEQNIIVHQQYTFPGSEISFRDIAIVKHMKKYIDGSDIHYFSIFNYYENYDFNLDVFSTCNQIKSHCIIHQYNDQCIGYHIPKNQFIDLNDHIKKYSYCTKSLHRMVDEVNGIYLSNSINEISFDQIIRMLDECSNNQIITYGSIFKRLTDLFFINQSVINYMNTFGVESLKQLIIDYIDIYQITKYISDSTLNSIKLHIKNNNISIRNIVSLDHGIKNEITKNELIDTFKKYNIDSYYQILDNEIIVNVHWDIFYPLESIDYDYPFCIIIPSHNNISTFSNTLNSIYNQSYDNYRVIYIDDNSDNNECDVVKQYVDSLNQNSRTILISQIKRQRQCAGRFIGYHMSYDDEIVLFVDGDDKLYDNAIQIVNNRYKMCDIVLTYGGYFDMIDNQVCWDLLKGIESFPINIIVNNNYRNYKFITTHLRTGFAKLFKSINLNDLLDNNNEFCHLMSDFVEMIPALEMATYKPNTIINKKFFDTIIEPLYIYSVDNSIKYLTSYARRNEPNNIYKQYRNQIETKLKNIAGYKSLIMSYIQTSNFHNFTHTMIQNNKNIIIDTNTMFYLVKKYLFNILTFDPITTIYTGYNDISDSTKEYPTIYLTGTIINHMSNIDNNYSVQYKHAITINQLINCNFVLIKNSLVHFLK